MDATSHGRVILSCILRNPGGLGLRLLDRAMALPLTDEHFADPNQRVLFILARRYADQARGIITRAALEDFLRQQDPGKTLLYLTLYDSLTAEAHAASEFLHSLSQVKDLDTERRTGDSLAQAMQILRHGARDEHGLELRGHADARGYLMKALGDIDRRASSESPEGDTGREAAAVREAYALAQSHRANGTSPGVSTGMPLLDARLGGGLYRGQLCLIAAWTSIGKTAVCVNFAWNAAVMQGKNVVYFTSETLREEVRLRLVTRHSMLPGFGLAAGEAPGLNSRDVRAGTLSAFGFSKLGEVLHDWEHNPAYGKRYVVQLPRGATMSVVEARLAAISRQFQPDLVVIDYLALLRAENARKDRREDLSGILMDAKEGARTFADGLGVPLISPWQVNRDGWKQAKERKEYDLAALAESAEASNSADIVLTLLESEADDGSRGRRVPLSLDILKNRAGEKGRNMKIVADYATSTFAAVDTTAGQQAVTQLLS